MIPENLEEQESDELDEMMERLIVEEERMNG